MKKIGITGLNGFIGNHLNNKLKLLKEDFEMVKFDRSLFDAPTLLDEFVSQCDVIIHLAAINRNDDPTTLYETNITLAKSLLNSLERTGKKPHILISSSTQEEQENPYGRSKKEGRRIFSEWSKRAGAKFTGLIIPNVYGPFGRPFYNSVVATFCHQLACHETPVIKTDGMLKLIYVEELVDLIIDSIRTENNSHELKVPHTAEIKVSELLSVLSYFKNVYQDNGEIPELKNSFEKKLFNTYRCYMDIPNYFPRKLVQHTDERGAFVEIARLGMGGQTSFSTTVPGITRGNHFHTRKIERFAVIKGKALIQLRRFESNEVYEFYLDGEEPAYVDMPIWYTHNIKNVGEDTLYTIFWINEPYNEKDPDTYFETV
ncbi:MAG: NAD-dependent epimerase/dehydratase family protein [Brumimicrobium sp.]|nr:NAD-dependent epimerase/dehydratase family protein [Brumimicrobium sp.]